MGYFTNNRISSWVVENRVHKFSSKGNRILVDDKHRRGMLYPLRCLSSNESFNMPLHLYLLIEGLITLLNYRRHESKKSHLMKQKIDIPVNFFHEFLQLFHMGQFCLYCLLHYVYSTKGYFSFIRNILFRSFNFLRE